jgi:hypothetical protein
LEPDESWKDIKPLGPITDSRTDAEKKVDGDFIPPSPHLTQPDGDIMEPVKDEDISIAIINIKPQEDVSVVYLKAEITKLKEYSLTRTITKDEDISPITDDLSLISNLKKALKEKADEYIKPIKGHLASVQTVFNDILAILDEADQINRNKIMAYRNEQKRRQAEADELNRQAVELARKQAEFSGTGEFTVNTEPVIAAPVVKKVSTTMGTVATQTIWKWELEDLSKVPNDYKIIDASKITKVVKAGLRNIPGIRIYSEDTLRVNAR